MSNAAHVFENLDADELLHFSLRALEENKTESAILYLKRLLEIEPDNGNALYLLGASHASIGMYPRAIEEMRRAIEIKPDLPPTAPFQLGLLYLTSGQVAEAETAWAALDDLEDDHFLVLFRAGMMHLIRDDFQACIENLKRGIENNNFNESLNNDMRNIIERARAALEARGPTAKVEDQNEEEASPKTKTASADFLSAYRRYNEDNS